MIDINPSILIAQIITFLIAVLVLWKAAWGPLYNIMKDRSLGIKNDLAAAAAARENAEKLEKDYKAGLQRIQEEAAELIRKAQAEGGRQKEEIIRAAQEEAEKLIRKARQQLDDDKDRIMRQLRGEVAGLSVEIAERLLKGCLDKNMHEKLLSEAMQQIDGLRKN